MFLWRCVYFGLGLVICFGYLEYSSWCSKKITELDGYLVWQNLMRFYWFKTIKDFGIEFEDRTNIHPFFSYYRKGLNWTNKDTCSSHLFFFLSLDLFGFQFDPLELSLYEIGLNSLFWLPIYGDFTVCKKNLGEWWMLNFIK